MNSKKKMLWVEDDYRTIEALLVPTIRAGINVDYAETFLEAKSIIQENNGYDLYLIDLILPYGSNDGPLDDNSLLGIDLIRYIRNHIAKEVPIYVLSVVYDERFDKHLEQLKIEEKLQKGTYSSRELRDKILKSIKS